MFSYDELKAIGLMMVVCAVLICLFLMFTN